MLRSTATLVVLGFAVLVGTAAGQQPAPAPAGAPAVLVVDTVKGIFEIETFPTDAPKSVARIVELVRANFYRGQRIHGSSPGVIEFGDPASRNMQRMTDWGLGGSGRRIGVKEVSKRSFDRGIVGYAYRKDRQPEDADSQLFVLKIGNPALNGKYAPIGRVSRGMDVVDKLATADVIRTVTIKGAAAPAAK
jgi:peptidyl-prolyl cis-trans isomerase B (cyclophilin B)